MEKIWATVSTTEGQWFDCSIRSLEITVLLPNCFKSLKHCQQYADARRWRLVILCFVTSFITRPVNSALLISQYFFFLLPASLNRKIIVQQSKTRNIDLNRALGNKNISSHSRLAVTHHRMNCLVIESSTLIHILSVESSEYWEVVSFLKWHWYMLHL